MVADVGSVDGPKGGGVVKDFWIVLPRGVARRWEVEHLTVSQAFNRSKDSAVLAMCGPYRNAKEAAEAQRDAETARFLTAVRTVRVRNFTHGRGTR